MFGLAGHLTSEELRLRIFDSIGLAEGHFAILALPLSVHVVDCIIGFKILSADPAHSLGRSANRSASEDLVGSRSTDVGAILLHISLEDVVGVVAWCIAKSASSWTHLPFNLSKIATNHITELTNTNTLSCCVVVIVASSRLPRGSCSSLVSIPPMHVDNRHSQQCSKKAVPAVSCRPASLKV